MSGLAPLFAALCTGFLVGLLWAAARGPFALRAATKTAASLSFVGLGLSLGLHQGGPVQLAILAGLGLSMVGDVALLGKARAPFLAGLIAFLSAHVAYIVAFALLGLHPLGVAVGALVMGSAAIGVWRWMKPHLGDMQRPVIAYMVVITVMVALAVGSFVDAQGAGPIHQRAGLLVAALMFWVSDLLVARQRFVADDVRNRLIGLPLYYVAQMLFAGFGAT